MRQGYPESLAREELLHRGWELLGWNGDRHGTLEFSACKTAPDGVPLVLSLLATSLERAWSWEAILDGAPQGRVILDRGLMGLFDEDAAADLIVRGVLLADEVAGETVAHVDSNVVEADASAVIPYWPHSTERIGILIESLRANVLLAKDLSASVEEVAWGVHDPFFRELEIREISIAISRLHPDLRSVVMMRYAEGLSIGEIARRVNRTETTVRVQIGRAVDRLRMHLLAEALR